MVDVDHRGLRSDKVNAILLGVQRYDLSHCGENNAVFMKILPGS
jgi:hypothetical protein